MRFLRIVLTVSLLSILAVGQSDSQSSGVNLKLKLTFAIGSAYADKENAGWCYLRKRQQIAVFRHNITEIINIATGSTVQTLPPMKFLADHYVKELSPDETRLVTRGLGKKDVALWDLSTGKFIATVHNQGKEIDEIEWSPDSRYILLKNRPYSRDKEHYVWDGLTGKLTSVIETKFKSWAQFSPNSATVLTCENDLAYRSSDRVKIWDVANGSLIKEFKLPYNAQFVNALFTPDGKQVIVVNPGKRMDFFETDTGTLEHSVALKSGGLGNFSRLNFSPDGKLLLVNRARFRGLTKEDETWFEIYDAATVELIRDLRTQKAGKHQVEERQFAWRPDSKAIVSAGERYTKNYEAESLDVSTGRQLFLLSGLVAKPERGLIPDPGYRDLDTISYTPDSKLLLTLNREFLRIWDAETGRLQKTYGGDVRTVFLTSDSKYLVQISRADKTVTLYELIAA